LVPRLPPPPCPNYGVHHRTLGVLSSPPSLSLVEYQHSGTSRAPKCDTGGMTVARVEEGVDTSMAGAVVFPGEYASLRNGMLGGQMSEVENGIGWKVVGSEGWMVGTAMAGQDRAAAFYGRSTTPHCWCAMTSSLQSMLRDGVSQHWWGRRLASPHAHSCPVLCSLCAPARHPHSYHLRGNAGTAARHRSALAAALDPSRNQARK
jgi:hypothetical protein